MTLAMMSVPAVSAQEASAEDDLEVIEVSGIRASLTSALAEKRDAPNLIEVIKADDVGKLPDQNLAEVLENITGVQITRTAGIGTGVQIRGSNANRVEINGVSTVGSGAGRNGISFEDINASIISAVEVTKASQAKTIEGSIGGTVNLRTIRPLELSDTLAAVRVLTLKVLSWLTILLLLVAWLAKLTHHVLAAVFSTLSLFQTFWVIQINLVFV